MSALAGILTGVGGLALYAGHHVGDYWVQTDHQAAHKGAKGQEGILACAMHVATYTLTQAAFLALAAWTTGLRWNLWAFLGALAVSAITHYLADRREYGIMFRLARLLPGKDRFLTLGVPRPGREDNPSLGTGAWALDQSWHIFWGVFVAALVLGLGA
jgi:hypothetical protein